MLLTRRELLLLAGSVVVEVAVWRSMPRLVQWTRQQLGLQETDAAATGGGSGAGTLTPPVPGATPGSGTQPGSGTPATGSQPAKPGNTQAPGSESRPADPQSPRSQPKPASPAEPTDPASPGGQPVLVTLLSDAHTQSSASPYARSINGKLRQAVADLQQFGPDYWLCDGDQTDHGFPSEYIAFREILGGVADPGQLLVCPGNHEYYDPDAPDDLARRRFQEAFGLPHPYSSRIVAGIHLVMLADEQYKTAPKNGDWAWLSPAQLRWFDQVLAENRDRFTAVFLHQPLQETVYGTDQDDGFAGTGQTEELREILRRNPQIRLWFSGHTHYRIDLDGQMVRQGTTTFAALGSTCYLYTPSPGAQEPGDVPPDFHKDTELSQSRVLEIWPDRINLRTRDHAARRWIDRLDLTLPRL